MASYWVSSSSDAGCGPDDATDKTCVSFPNASWSSAQPAACSAANAMLSCLRVSMRSQTASWAAVEPPAPMVVCCCLLPWRLVWQARKRESRFNINYFLKKCGLFFLLFITGFVDCFPIFPCRQVTEKHVFAPSPSCVLAVRASCELLRDERRLREQRQASALKPPPSIEL
jgi:hypothetical protein